MSGGGSSSSQNTTNNYDQRQVNTNTSYDLSNHSQTTTNADFSNRSVNTNNNTTNADFSNRSTNNSWTSSNSNSNNTNTTNADFSNRSTSNLWDNSATNSNNTTTNNADFSNRSVNNTSTTNSTSADFSNRSTSNLWDSSTKNTNSNNTSITYNTTTDGGAVQTALNTVGGAAGAVVGFAQSVVSSNAQQTRSAYDYADSIFHGALDATNKNDARAFDAYDRAAKMENDLLTMNARQSQSTIDTIKAAYADAKGTSDGASKIMIGALVLAGVAVVAARR